MLLPDAVTKWAPLPSSRIQWGRFQAAVDDLEHLAEENPELRAPVDRVVGLLGAAVAPTALLVDAAWRVVVDPPVHGCKGSRCWICGYLKAAFVTYDSTAAVPT